MYIRNDTYEVIEDPFPDCFEVDDLIAPAISVLNRKGYITAFCCSGHENNPHKPGGSEIAYIQFEFGGMTPEYLPDGWYWESDGQMEYEFKEASRKIIETVMSELSVWAEALPDITKDTVML